jgi:hypothetical protein
VAVLYAPERAATGAPAEMTVVFRYGGPGTGYRRHTYTRGRAWGEGDAGPG